MAAIASSFVRLCPVDQLVNAMLRFETIGMTTNATRKIVPGTMNLSGNEPLVGMEVDDVDQEQRRSDRERRDPLVVREQDADRPDPERVDGAEQDELDDEADGAREEADRAREERRGRDGRLDGLGCDGGAGHR